MLTKEKNIEIIKKLGGGASRNIGIEKARGKWIIFADADDFFNYCIEEILSKYNNSEADIIYFKGNSVDTNTYTTTYRTNHLNKWIDQYEKHPQKAEMSLRYLLGEPWCKIIRKSLIGQYHIRFDETTIHNDTTFSYLIGHYAKKIIVDKRALYCVTTRANSVSVSVNNDKELIRVDVFSRAEQFFRQDHIPECVKWHYKQCAEFLIKGKWEYYKKAIKIIKKNVPFGAHSYLLLTEFLAKGLIRLILFKA